MPRIKFTYDNAAHHPKVATHPDHKHTPAGVEPASAPDLTDVLREIDERLYEKRARVKVPDEIHI